MCKLSTEVPKGKLGQQTAARKFPLVNANLFLRHLWTDSILPRHPVKLNHGIRKIHGKGGIAGKMRGGLVLG